MDQNVEKLFGFRLEMKGLRFLFRWSLIRISHGDLRVSVTLSEAKGRRYAAPQNDIVLAHILYRINQLEARGLLEKYKQVSR
jgi:hypothetical protein